MILGAPRESGRNAEPTGHRRLHRTRGRRSAGQAGLRPHVYAPSASQRGPHARPGPAAGIRPNGRVALAASMFPDAGRCRVAKRVTTDPAHTGPLARAPVLCRGPNRSVWPCVPRCSSRTLTRANPTGTCPAGPMVLCPTPRRAPEAHAERPCDTAVGPAPQTPTHRSAIVRMGISSFRPVPCWTAPRGPGPDAGGRPRGPGDQRQHLPTNIGRSGRPAGVDPCPSLRAPFGTAEPPAFARACLRASVRAAPRPRRHASARPAGRDHRALTDHAAEPTACQPTPAGHLSARPETQPRQALPGCRNPAAGSRYAPASARLATSASHPLATGSTASSKS